MARQKIQGLRRAHITLHRNLYDKVQKHAIAQGMSTSEFVRRLLDEWFTKQVGA